VGQTLLKIMGDDQDPYSRLSQRQKHPQQLRTTGPIEAIERLIEDQEFWLCHQGRRYGEPALLTTRKHRTESVIVASQTGRTESRIHPPPIRDGTFSGGPGPELSVFAHGNAEYLMLRLLEYQGDASACLSDDSLERLVVNKHLTRIGLFEAQGMADEKRLAAAVAA
jgi:hypothetical protein